MGDDSKRREEQLMSTWEQQCIDEVENGTDNIEQQISIDKDIGNQKLWMLFQNAATNISQMYKERHQSYSPNWVGFQNAAAAVTCLYKESVETQKRTSDLGIHCGHQRRNRDLMAWAKKRRRHIRREDLISFLAGKSSTYSARSSPRPKSSSIDRAASRFAHDSVQSEADLHTFREAMAISSLNGAMSSISVGIHRPHGSTSPTSQSARHHRRTSASGNSSPSATDGSAAANHISELYSFMCEEFTRHLKRPSNHDMVMDSPPSQKRSRFI